MTLDTENEPGIMLIYITPMSLLKKKKNKNLKNCCLIPLSVLKIPNKLQKYFGLYCFELFLPNNTPKSFHIKPFTFINNDPLN